MRTNDLLKCLDSTPTKRKTAHSMKDGLPKPKMGRPKVYDRQKVFARVCELIATSELGVARILKDEPGMPCLSKFWAWMDKRSECGTLTLEARDLRDLYARAKQLQAEYMASLLLEICDDSRNDYMDKAGKDGESYQALNAEHIQRTRLRIDTRKWLMAKLHPKKYADSIKVGGDEELAPVKSETTISTDNMDALREALKKHLKG